VPTVVELVFQVEAVQERLITEEPEQLIRQCAWLKLGLELPVRRFRFLPQTNPDHLLRQLDHQMLCQRYTQGCSTLRELGQEEILGAELVVMDKWLPPKTLQPLPEFLVLVIVLMAPDKEQIETAYQLAIQGLEVVAAALE
jgi:hypothetical protein